MIYVSLSSIVVLYNLKASIDAEKIALDHREKEEVVECVQEETTVTKPT